MSSVADGSDNFDTFTAEIDAAIAELRDELTDADRAEIARWLNTEIDSETADAIDAELDAYFERTYTFEELVERGEFRLTAAEKLALAPAPYGAESGAPDSDSDSDSGPSETAGDVQTGGADGTPRTVTVADVHGTGERTYLNAKHLEFFADRGISPEFAATRGYETILAAWRLGDSGINLAKQARTRVPGLYIPWLDFDGNVIAHQYRPDDPRWTKHKKPKCIKYEMPRKQPNRLHFPPGVDMLVGDPAMPLWIAESAIKADCLADNGLCAVGINGIWGWRGTNDLGGTCLLSDFHGFPLNNGRKVVIAYDSDVSTNRDVRNAAVELAGVLRNKGSQPLYLHLPTGEDGEKIGVDDYLADEHTVEELGDLVLDHPPGAGEGGQGSDSVATQLVKLGRNSYALGITDADQPFAIHQDHPHIALLLRAGKVGLRRELARTYFDLNQAAPSGTALADALGVLESLAAQEQPRRVHLRVAEHDGAVYIDMGDLDGRVIRIGGGTWEIVGSAPVLFHRTKLSAAMPEPVSVGSGYEQLWGFVPVHEISRPLVLAWAVQALISPDTSHPVLGLLAEHGSIKSTGMRCLVELIDPSAVPLRKVPRDAEAWVTAAAGSWVVGLDNVSGAVPQWLSDSLCRAVTGDGDVRRALYTDGDLALFAYRRVVVFNGIDIEVTQGDLADRLLRVGLPRVLTRRTDAEVAADWAAERPVILGGLLDLAAKLHARLPDMVVDEPPRMADYAHVLAAVDEIGGTNGLEHYRKQAGQVAADTLEHPFIGELINRKYSCTDKTATEILAEITPTAPGYLAADGWPKTANNVTGLLRRHAPQMRLLGWQIDDDEGRNHINTTRWTIAPPAGMST
ncbi:hypothetical protein NJB18091_37110 [Mycobacterium marinum]|uniref:DUF3854 domain-containing protein n=1 Tax=Mycobacterium marinum TaxID=1781 RepID=UPI0021C2A7EB|nr:DUF3854 domain-containing protein [Mycobacterium marinum]GJO02327.1 hypothetical protein NJB18091_37110 [Mycobacterium marinum]